MPHPARLKIRMPGQFQNIPNGDLPFLNELPQEVQEEVRDKIQKGEKHVQFRMPLDVWARMRARQFEMNRDAEELLQQNDLPAPSRGINLVPMSEIIRKMFDAPLRVQDQDILGMVHKGRGKGRLFK